VDCPADLAEALHRRRLVTGLPILVAASLPLPLDIARAGYVESTLSVRWVAPRLAAAAIEAAEGRGKPLA
jgi:hypothetical protein